MFERALGLDPDVVVYGMTLNDCELSPSFRARHPLLAERLRGHARADAPASRRPFGLRSIAFLPRQWEMFRVRWGMAEWYRDLYSQANRDGVSLGGGYPLEQVHEAITAFCRGAGIACLDLLPALQGRSSVSLWVHPVDTHPNELAHRFATANLAPAVRHLIEDGHR